mmetsp:Transcript_44016/g.111347  ORF Transcript_44016/g.111347 Transcript_44016/m.111347 type:complete len:481 (+) Transcript_44016:3840-5282(+)
MERIRCLTLSEPVDAKKVLWSRSILTTLLGRPECSPSAAVKTPCIGSAAAAVVSAAAAGAPNSAVPAGASAAGGSAEGSGAAAAGTSFVSSVREGLKTCCLVALRSGGTCAELGASVICSSSMRMASSRSRPWFSQKLLESASQSCPLMMNCRRVNSVRETEPLYRLKNLWRMLGSHARRPMRKTRSTLANVSRRSASPSGPRLVVHSLCIRLRKLVSHSVLMAPCVAPLRSSCARRCRNRTASFTLRQPVAVSGSSSHLRTIIRISMRTAGEVALAPVMSTTSVCRKSFLWSVCRSTRPRCAARRSAAHMLHVSEPYAGSHSAALESSTAFRRSSRVAVMGGLPPAAAGREAAVLGSGTTPLCVACRDCAATSCACAWLMPCACAACCCCKMRLPCCRAWLLSMRTTGATMRVRKMGLPASVARSTDREAATPGRLGTGSWRPVASAASTRTASMSCCTRVITAAAIGGGPAPVSGNVA